MNVPSVLPVLDAAVGIWLVAAGMLGRRKRPGSRVGPLMMLAGGAWLVGSFVPALYFVHRGPLVQLHLSYPSGRLHRSRVVAVTVAVYIASLSPEPRPGRRRLRTPVEAGRSGDRTRA